MTVVVALPTGAAMRRTGDRRAPVVCVNGGQAAPVPGDWSASMEWLVGRLAPEHPGWRSTRCATGVKTWNRLESCIEDAAPRSTPSPTPAAGAPC